MAKKNDLLKEWMSWGCENEHNRKEAIEAACFVIATLNSRSSEKKLSQQELDKLCGGRGGFAYMFHNDPKKIM